MRKNFILLISLLLISVFLVTLAGYAWFTASNEVDIRGVNVRSETKGYLKVWTPNRNGIPNIHSSYTNYMDFSDPEDGFYNPDYANHIMKDQSGNGALFYMAVPSGHFYKYGIASGRGVALVYDLYFTSYTGNEEQDMRDVYLDSILIQNTENVLDMT